MKARSSNSPKQKTKRRSARCGTTRSSAAIFPAPIGRCWPSAATDALMRRAFGDVHMLSHMVGAANRADIRRLRQLEEENAALSAKLDAQQRQLRDGFIARDEKIRLLNEALSRALAQAPVDAAYASEDLIAARNALVDIARRRIVRPRTARASKAGSMPQRARRRCRNVPADEAARACDELRRKLALAEKISAPGSGKTRPQHRASPAPRCSTSAAAPIRCRSSRRWRTPVASSSTTTAASSTAWPCCRA